MKPHDSARDCSSDQDCRPWETWLVGKPPPYERGCVTAVQFILFNFADYSPSIAMELKVSKEITWK